MKNHKRRKLTFHESVKKYGIWKSITHRIKKARIPKWFWIASIVMIITGVISSLYKITISSIDILPIIFYISEIAVVGYLLFGLLKKLDKIHIGSNIRLFGLRILSIIIIFIGGVITLTLLMYYFTRYIWFGSFYTYVENPEKYVRIEEPLPFFNFGIDFGIPLAGQIFLMMIGIGFLIIGAYLLFKFKRRTGTFHWIGRA